MKKVEDYLHTLSWKNHYIGKSHWTSHGTSLKVPQATLWPKLGKYTKQQIVHHHNQNGIIAEQNVTGMKIAVALYLNKPSLYLIAACSIKN